MNHLFFRIELICVLFLLEIKGNLSGWHRPPHHNPPRPGEPQDSRFRAHLNVLGWKFYTPALRDVLLKSSSSHVGPNVSFPALTPNANFPHKLRHGEGLWTTLLCALLLDTQRPTEKHKQPSDQKKKALNDSELKEKEKARFVFLSWPLLVCRIPVDSVSICYISGPDHLYGCLLWFF